MYISLGNLSVPNEAFFSTLKKFFPDDNYPGKRKSWRWCGFGTTHVKVLRVQNHKIPPHEENVITPKINSHYVAFLVNLWWLNHHQRWYRRRWPTRIQILQRHTAHPIGLSFCEVHILTFVLTLFTMIYRPLLTQIASAPLSILELFIRITWLETGIEVLWKLVKCVSSFPRIEPSVPQSLIFFFLVLSFPYNRNSSFYSGSRFSFSNAPWTSKNFLLPKLIRRYRFRITKYRNERRTFHFLPSKLSRVLIPSWF